MSFFLCTRQADSKIPMEKEVIISRQTREKRISIGGWLPLTDSNTDDKASGT